MRNYLLFCLALLNVFLFNGYAQLTYVNLNQKKAGVMPNHSLVEIQKNYIANKKVHYYHVEEIVNMKFGGYKTTYDVSDASLIRSYDMGPNNARIITIMYVDLENIDQLGLTPKTELAVNKNTEITLSESPKGQDTYAYVDIIKTYERMSSLGYVSIEMLKKMGDTYFFNEEPQKAIKIYTELCKMTSDLEPEYYYRFSLSLKSIGENNKANEMLQKFNELSGNETRE